MPIWTTAMMWRIFFILFQCVLSSAELIAKSPSSEELINREATQKGYKLLSKDKEIVGKIPHYFAEYGELHVNYDLDEKGRPFIWCEQISAACIGKTGCIRNIKCYPERRSHKLGCMAVFVYNEAEFGNSSDIYSIPPNVAMLKGCWSQHESELSECLKDVECVTHTRATGERGRSAKFCCCRTNFCNQNLTLSENLPSDTPQLNATVLPHVDIEFPHYLFNSTTFLIIIFIILALTLVTTSVATFLLIQKRRHKIEMIRLLPTQTDKSDPDYSMELTSECVALLGSRAALNLSNAKLTTLMSSGQFGELYKADVSGVAVAIRVYQSEESDGWINEQEVFALKSVRANEHIVDFLGSFRTTGRYWIIYKYYYIGSMYDYLDSNVLSVPEALKLLSTMMNGLSFLHEEFFYGGSFKPSIVHRDFKSKNVLIKSDFSTCITDFGLALKCENGRIENEENQAQVGTRRYMSPEILEGATEFTSFAFQQIDVYAASLVVWEALSRIRVPECPDEIVPAYLLPYEREVGKAPTLGRMRELVVLRKFRPLPRETMFDNTVLTRVVKTMRDMWDSEPDGRITSSCARDRLQHYYEMSLGVCSMDSISPSDSHHDQVSLDSSASESSVASSFVCASATGTTIPVAPHTTSSQDHLTSSNSSIEESWPNSNRR